MTNTMSGPYSKTTWTDGVTMGTHVNMGNLETQSGVALGSFNPDLVTSGFVLNGGLATRHNAYKAAVLVDTPLRYYRLDETSGTAVTDAVTGVVDATAVGSPTQNVAGLLAGDANTCYTFAAASSQYVYSSGTGLNTGTNAPVTIECWFKFAANPASTQFIMCVGDRGTAGKFFALVLTATGTVQISNGNNVVTSAVLTTGVAHHLVGTFDGTTEHLYVDGAQVGTGTATALTLAYVGANPFVIGAATSGTGPISPASFFSGQVDEVCYYSGALSGTRITAHYTAGSTATTQVDIASGKAYLLQSDGTLAGCTIGATTQTTVTINTTYHLYLQPDGSWYWSTSNTPAANSLAFATVTTDGSGNATLVTDARPLTIPLFAGATGNVYPNAPGGSPQQAVWSGSSLTLSGTPQDIPGCALMLSAPGQYLIIGTTTGFSNGGGSVVLYCNVNGTRQTLTGYAGLTLIGTTGTFQPVYTATQTWIVTVSAGQNVKLQASGGGTAPVLDPNSNTTASIIAQWLHQ